MKIYSYPSQTAETKIQAITNRGLSYTKEQYDTVTRIIEDVKQRGDQALIEYTRQFDAPDMDVSNMTVTQEEFDHALRGVDSEVIHSLDLAIAQIEAFHQKQLRQSWISTDRSGTFLGQLVNPVDAAGVYVPGGTGGNTPLVSSVLMGAIPAKIAGVKEIVLVTPPTKDGSINPYLIVAAQKAGIRKIFKTGSAWAIAALTYGTKTIPKVDVIVGPGNIYVTLAKKIVSGTVGIDMVAGPSEILVIADETANPDFIAADLLSQAEHDILASSILVSTSRDFAQKVVETVDKQLKNLHRQDIARKSLDQFGAILVVPTLEKAIEVSNRIAPEHLELQIADPFAHLGDIRHAGAVFIGHYTPEPVGDYIAGPNHVLPTAGTARFSSALSVDTFIKKTSLISYSKTAFNHQAQDIIRLAKIEGLDAHANSVAVRLDKQIDKQQDK